MRVASLASRPAAEREALRRRAVSLVLTVLAHLLLLLLLLRLAPEQFRGKPEERLTTFNIAPGERAAAPEAKSSARTRRRAGGAPRPAEAQTPPPPEPVPPPPPPTTPPVAILPLTRQEMAAADIATIRSDVPARVAGDADRSDARGDSTGEATNIPGVGTVTAYRPEWYREPTDAELAFYLPKGRRVVGTGYIACKTIARFHVDDCRELGDTPPGTGISHSVAQAAWQFLVRPPRVDGKALIGAWVVIEFRFTERGTARG